jgi:16S rRNA processing protein RimM
VLAGEIGKPHGVRGEVYVVPASDEIVWDPGTELVHGNGRKLVVRESRSHRGNRMLVKFEAVATRDEADSLRGAVYARGKRKRHLGVGEYWAADLIGCSVVDPGGRPLGVVLNVVEGVAQDLLEVERPGANVLVPLVGAIVTEVAIDARRIVVDPPKELFE